MAFLELRGLTRYFGSLAAVDGVSLCVGAGEFFTLLGPSGCGKTTLLRLVAGLEVPDAGDVLLEGRSLAAVPPEARPLHTVFQSYALFPHLTVARNVAFPLRMAGVAKQEVAPRVEDALARVRLAGLGGRYPHQLSGGQRQRVALARALVGRPKVLLLDEPLAALDLKLRQEMQRELVALQREVGITFLYVTHDQGEALALSDRIAVLEHGRVAQVGEPREVYDRPANRYVADFLGRCNLLPAMAEAVEGSRVRFAVDGVGTVVAAAGALPEVGTRGTFCLRPERATLAAAPGEESRDNRFSALVRERVYSGETTLYRVAVAGGALLEVSLPNSERRSAWEPGQPVELSWSEDAGHFLLPE